MRIGMAVSAVLHAVLVTLAIFGLPVLFHSEELAERLIVVELFTVAEETTPTPPPKPEPPEPEPKVAAVAEPRPELEAIKPPPKPEPEPPKPEPVKAEPAPPPPPPEPEPVKAPPPPPPEPEKQVAVLEPEPEPAPKPKPKPEPPKPVAKTVEPAPKPKPRPKPRPKTVAKPKKQSFDADRIAALLDKKIKKANSTPPRPREEAEKQPPEKTTRPTPTRVATQPLTLSEKDAIRVQIERCWSVPAGAKDAENLIVRIRIFLNPDGSLRGQPEIVDRARMEQPGEEYFRTAAESARRAVLKCTPLQQLPVTKYERWRDIELTFNPREMLEARG
jgi:hypothetical protein